MYPTKHLEKNSILYGLAALSFSFLLIAVCSRSSFLYPINDWSDANCYFTIGKSLLHGKVLYRDIFDHKGPYLYFLHTAAYLISRRTFVGVYFFEVLACFATLHYMQKTLALLSVCAPLTAALFFGSLIYSGCLTLF